MDQSTDQSITPSQFSVIGDTIADKISSSINKQTDSHNLSLTNPPEFTGALKEDVQEFLGKFKVVTAHMSDKQKCLILWKALKGTAYDWAKSTIKDHLNDGSFNTAKKLLKERFLPVDYEQKYHDKLMKMKFTKEISLQSYIEEYFKCYRKTCKEVEDKTVIRSLKLNLPSNVKRIFALSDSNWTNYSSMKELTTLARKTEEILAYEPDDQGEKLTPEDVKKVMQEALLERKKLDEEEHNKKVKEEALALLTNDKRSPSPSSSESSHKKKFKEKTESRDDNIPSRIVKINESLMKKYVAKYGKPRNPCWHCGGKHFNKHCPLKTVPN